MVEDVVDIEPSHARTEAVERGIVKCLRVVFLAKVDAADAVVIARLSPEEVEANLVAIHAEIDVLPSTAIQMG